MTTSPSHHGSAAAASKQPNISKYDKGLKTLISKPSLLQKDAGVGVFIFQDTPSSAERQIFL